MSEEEEYYEEVYEGNYEDFDPVMKFRIDGEMKEGRYATNLRDKGNLTAVEYLEYDEDLQKYIKIETYVDDYFDIYENENEDEDEEKNTFDEYINKSKSWILEKYFDQYLNNNKIYIDIVDINEDFNEIYKKFVKVIDNEQMYEDSHRSDNVFLAYCFAILYEKYSETGKKLKNTDFIDMALEFLTANYNTTNEDDDDDEDW